MKGNIPKILWDNIHTYRSSVKHKMNREFLAIAKKSSWGFKIVGNISKWNKLGGGWKRFLEGKKISLKSR
jgi:hypothetical protein